MVAVNRGRTIALLAAALAFAVLFILGVGISRCVNLSEEFGSNS